MSMVLTADKAFSRVQEVAEKIKNDEVARVGTMSVGDVVRQGDVYIVCIGKLPRSLKKSANRQLAPGTTQGSRHVLVGNCEVYESTDKGEVVELIRSAVNSDDIHAELIGPVFKSLSELEVDHPEHGNRVLPADEVYAVYYQRQFAEEIRRVRD